MRALVLDAGALISVDRGDHDMVTRMKSALRRGVRVRTTGPVIAQAWRDPFGRQVQLAELLGVLEVVEIGRERGQFAGVLLGRAGMSDAVDATLVSIAESGDSILTSDPMDIGRLVAVAGVSVNVVGV